MRLIIIMIKIAICDDDEKQLILLCNYIKMFSDEQKTPISIHRFTTGNQLLNAPHQYDIIFLDIILESENGIEIGEALRRRNRTTYIIYITNFRQYHEAAHNVVHAFAYLIKPLTKEKIHGQLMDILSCRAQLAPNYFTLYFLTYENGLIELPIKDIYFFEYIKKRYIRIHSKKGIFHFNQKISQLNNDMSYYDFFMPHQSFIVNLKHVKAIKNYDLFMTNGTTVPLSQKRAVLFKNVLNDYLEKMLIRK